MAETGLPDVKRKQKMLFAEDTTEQTLIEHGQRFFSAGWYNDAIDFFERAGHVEGLNQIRQTASDEGDVFLFNRCLKAKGVAADDEEWRRIADQALDMGKLQFAREGYRMAGANKAMDKVDRMISPDLEQPDEDGGAA